VTTKDRLARTQERGRSSLAERAALVGLLNTRPGERTWPELTALVLERGEIGSVLADLDPTELFASQEQVAARKESLAQVEQWESEELDFITVLDDRYPERVREIHQDSWPLRLAAVEAGKWGCGRPGRRFHCDAYELVHQDGVGDHRQELSIVA